MKNFDYKILLPVLVLLFGDCVSVKSQKTPARGNIVLNLPPSEGNPRNSEGDFITLQDGRLLFVYTHYYGQSGSDHASAYLAGRYSPDGGATWTREDEIIVENEGKMNIRSVSLLRLHNGSIALFYLRHNARDDLIPMLRISKDEARTWSEPTPCITDRQGYFVVNNDRVIQLSGGRLLMPVSLHKTPDSEWSNKGEIRCYYSDDSGTTWRSGRAVPTPDSVVTQEPGVVALQDGRTMMIMRASGGEQLVSYSDDKGMTWTRAQPSGISSPISPASLERIPATGDLLLVWNDNGQAGPGYFKAKRTPLTVAVSTDEGQTWRHQFDIEDNPEGYYCYAAIHQADNHILLAYMSKRDAEKDIGITMRRLSIKSFYKKQANRTRPSKQKTKIKSPS